MEALLAVILENKEVFEGKEVKVRGDGDYWLVTTSEVGSNKEEYYELDINQQQLKKIA